MTKSTPPKGLVLYADDDPDDLQLIRDAFASYSETVRLLTFEDGASILNYIKKLSSFEPLPCLIILDINMPGMNGKEVLRKIRQIQEYEEVPIVMFSTSTLPSEADFAMSFGAGFVTKPLYTQQIDQLVEYIIQNCSEDTKRRFRGRRGKQ